MILHKVRIVAYEKNSTGRYQPFTKQGIIDLSRIEYMESDHIAQLGDCVIVRLATGKELTVMGKLTELYDAMGGKST